jgi:hypothetical protein
MLRHLYYAISTLLCLTTLTACLSVSTMTGTSVADRELKHDIIKRIQFIFRDHCRKIDRIDISNNSVVNDQDGHFNHAQETWVASACGKTMRFTVTITADPKGGTFFGLLYTP